MFGKLPYSSPGSPQEIPPEILSKRTLESPQRCLKKLFPKVLQELLQEVLKEEVFQEILRK